MLLREDSVEILVIGFGLDFFGLIFWEDCDVLLCEP